jgi:hypothetical protein
MSKTSNTSTTTQQQSGPPDFQAKALNDLFSRARDWMNNTQLQYPGFEQVAGFNPNETAGQQALLDFAHGGAQNVANQATNAWQFATGDVLSPTSNPYLAQYGDALAQGINRNFTQNINPALEGQAVASGQTGSSREALAQGVAAAQTNKDVANAQTQLYNNAYNTGLNTFNQGLALSPQIMALGMQPGVIESSVGAQQRGLTQAQLDEQTQGYWFNQLSPLMMLQAYQGLVGGNYGGQGTSSTTPPPTLWQQLGLGNPI